MQNMEQILEKFVHPELTNKIGFLRYRACQMYSRFGFIDFTNKNNIKLAVEGIYKCLKDEELPVRVAAAIALNQMAVHEEAVNILKPGL